MLRPADIGSSEPLPGAPSAVLPFDVVEVDKALAGGLQRGAVHEVYAESHGDAASASGFALATARRLAESGSILWIRQGIFDGETGLPHGAGLAEMGHDPARIMLVRVRDALAALQAGLDAARCSAVKAVVLEIWGDAKALDLTASRRLALAARASGATLLMTRVAATPAPSAAETRWQVRSCPSRPALANAPGHPVFHLRLLRQRSGVSGLDWYLEWNRDRTCFTRLDAKAAAGLHAGARPILAPAPASAADGTALSGAVVPLFAGGTAQAADRSERRTG
jgi:protein ImuA